MSEANMRRGRPKGSGLDDRKQLLNIAAMIAADPSLKPTTAIRALGVTDPSVIRRLRDKYSEMLERQHVAASNNTAARVAETGGPDAFVAPAAHTDRPGTGRNGGAINLAASIPREPVRREAPRFEVISGGDAGIAPRMREPLSPTADWLAAWCGMGLGAATTAFETQLALMQQMLRLPPVAMVLSGQVAINEMALSMVPRHPGFRQTLH